jgi:hypothetical protein
MFTITMVVHAALLAQASVATAKVGPSGSPCARYVSAVPARIDGQITSREDVPLPNIEVVATIAESGRRFSTASDRQGRYSVTGFDAAAIVHLEFRDAVKRLSCECSVNVPRSTPALRIDVVLEEPRPRGENGCQGATGPIFSTFLEGGPGIRRLTPEESKSYFPPEEKPAARLDIRAMDIQEVRMGEDGAALRLTPAGTEALRVFTEANVGRMAIFSIDGLPAGKSTIQGVIASGSAWVPAAELGGRLCEVLETRPLVEAKPSVKVDLGSDDIASVHWQSYGEGLLGASVSFTAAGGAKLENERRASPDRPTEVSIDGIHFLTLNPAMELPRGEQWHQASFGVGAVGKPLLARLRAIEKMIQVRSRK